MKLSVITICFNAAHEIARTLYSVLNQKYEDMEYIIVDGGSTDTTLAVIEEVRKKHKERLITVVSEPDKGIYDAMNKGLRRAKGEWVCMMNAGDMFTNESVLIEIFKTTIPQNISFIYSDFYKGTGFGKYFKFKTCCEEHKKTLVHQSVIYKKSLHERFGYYIVTPKIIISDYLFFLQIPVEETLKVETVISKYEGGGISESGGWCKQQYLCANVLFRHGSFWTIQLKYILWRVKTCLPRKVREWLRLKMSSVDNI